jgi:hypothetical protein
VFAFIRTKHTEIRPREFSWRWIHSVVTDDRDIRFHSCYYWSPCVKCTVLQQWVRMLNLRNPHLRASTGAGWQEILLFFFSFIFIFFLIGTLYSCFFYHYRHFLFLLIILLLRHLLVFFFFFFFFFFHSSSLILFLSFRFPPTQHTVLSVSTSLLCASSLWMEDKLTAMHHSFHPRRIQG